MKVLHVEVDEKPVSCQKCPFFLKKDNEDGWGGDWYECFLKVLMGIPLEGRYLLPCPLNPEVQEDCRKNEGYVVMDTPLVLNGRDDLLDEISRKLRNNLDGTD